MVDFYQILVVIPLHVTIFLRPIKMVSSTIVAYYNDGMLMTQNYPFPLEQSTLNMKNNQIKFTKTCYWPTKICDVINATQACLKSGP